MWENSWLKRQVGPPTENGYSTGQTAVVTCINHVGSAYISLRICALVIPCGSCHSASKKLLPVYLAIRFEAGINKF